MTEGEFAAWTAFHRHWPLDDHHRLYRPAALISASMNGQFEPALEFLSPPVRKKRAGRASVVRKKKD